MGHGRPAKYCWPWVPEEEARGPAAFLTYLGLSSEPLACCPDSWGFRELSLSLQAWLVAPLLFWEAWGGFEFRMLPGLAHQLSRVQA